MDRETVLYFAYGSNLSPRRLVERDVPVFNAFSARLPGHRLVFNKQSERYGAAANVMAHAASEVWGAVYEIAPSSLESLDLFESVHLGHYEQRRVAVEAASGAYHAVTYTACARHLCEPREPTEEYLAYIIEGAKHHGLSEEYIETIQQSFRM